MSGHHGTTSRLADNPLGPNSGGGLNGQNVAHAALRAEILAAVKHAHLHRLSRKTVVDLFMARGHGQQVVYRLIRDASAKTGIVLKHVRRRLPRTTMTCAEQDAHVTEVLPAIKAARASVDDIERAAKGKPQETSVPPSEASVAPDETVPGDVEPPSRALAPSTGGQLTNRPIDLAQRIHSSLDTIDKLARLAEHSDGSIRNPRLAITTVDLLGKTAERLARIQADLSDQSQTGLYLATLERAVLEECPPDVRQRVLNRLRIVNQSWGIDG